MLLLHRIWYLRSKPRTLCDDLGHRGARQHSAIHTSSTPKDQHKDEVLLRCFRMRCSSKFACQLLRVATVESRSRDSPLRDTLVRQHGGAKEGQRQNSAKSGQANTYSIHSDGYRMNTSHILRRMKACLRDTRVDRLIATR